MKSFKEFMDEASPLRKLMKSDSQDYHHVIISGARMGKSEAENKSRNNSLRKDFAAAGFGHKPTKGVWQNDHGQVEHEHSGMYKAKKPGMEGAHELLAFAHSMRKKYDQDAFIHRTPDGKGTAHNRDGSTAVYGHRTAMNTHNPYGETQFNPHRPEKARQKITFTDTEKKSNVAGSTRTMK